MFQFPPNKLSHAAALTFYSVLLTFHRQNVLSLDNAPYYELPKNNNRIITG